jgi:hypothetical protein
MLGPVTQEFLDKLVDEFNSDEVQHKIKGSVLEPLFTYIHSKIYTYLQFIGLLMGLIILLLVIIICLQLKFRK